MKSSVRIFGFIWLSAIAINLSAQNFAKDSTKLFKYIFFLSSDSLGGRLGGSINEKSAADYIVLQLKKSKIKPFFEKSYIQNFEFTYEGQTHYSQNVAAFIDNKVDSTIIIISHYDHIGNGGKLSKSFGSDKIHPGADDNASGVAANLLLAEKVKKRNNKKFNYIFLFTGAHECGLFGSKYFCEMLDELQLKIKYVINLDMIGRLDEETKTLVFSSTIENVNNQSLFEASNNKLLFQNKDGLIGDQTVFQGKNIPVLILSTGIHNDYHKISDKIQFINFNGIFLLTKTVYRIINPSK